jgi:anti-sigma factor RsiW
MSAEPNLTDQDYELLSAYIDGMLTDGERIALESRLQHETTLRRELNGLRQTVNLVNQLPRRNAPRDFTLSPEMARRIRRSSQGRTPRNVIPLPWLSALSAVAAAFLVVMGVSLLISTNNVSNDSAAQPIAGIMSNTIADDAIAQLATGTPAETGEGSISLFAATEDSRIDETTTETNAFDTVEEIEAEPGFAPSASDGVGIVAPPAAPSDESDAFNMQANENAPLAIIAPTETAFGYYLSTQVAQALTAPSQAYRALTATEQVPSPNGLGGAFSSSEQPAPEQQQLQTGVGGETAQLAVPPPTIAGTQAIIIRTPQPSATTTTTPVPTITIAALADTGLADADSGADLDDNEIGGQRIPQTEVALQESAGDNVDSDLVGRDRSGNAEEPSLVERGAQSAKESDANDDLLPIALIILGAGLGVIAVTTGVVARRRRG